ncbi:hypothetical protein OEZ86_013543 [Tetradesmus obliquus]|nr:hypothetical protein OEZ86_013543 [Tetradesmus obliquus]
MQGSSISVALPQWKQVGWAVDVSTVVAFALKGWMNQVPIRWFLPLLGSEMAINVLGALKHGLPLPWLLLRYSCCTLLPLALFGLQQVQGRARFCVRHGVRVQGRLLPLPSWA